MSRQTGLTDRIRRLYRTFTVLDPLLLARVFGVTQNQIAVALRRQVGYGRLQKHRARNARRKYSRTAYTLPGGTP